MKQHVRGGLILALPLIAATALGVAAVAQSNAQKEEFTAFAINMNRGRAGVVDIVIESWSPDGDREALLGVFMEKGQDAMLRALQDRPRHGYLKLPNTLGWDIRYAVQQPLDEGGRRIIVVTDRPVSFGEARNQGRSMDYPFTMIEMRFGKDGRGVGKMSTGTQIKKSKDGKHLELETWDTQPVQLNEITSKMRKM